MYSDATEFEMRGDFMFVTRPSTTHPGALDLFVSSHGERFVEARLGEDVVSVDYHIIDVTPEGKRGL